MEEAQEVQLPRTVFEGATETNPNEDGGSLCSQTSAIIKMKKKYLYWLRIALYIITVLVGQSSAILLGRLYYQQGGKSKWMGALVQLVGFPIILPLYTIPASKYFTTKNTIFHNNNKKRYALKLASVFVLLGFLLALDTFLYAIGLSNLPVSTYSVIFSLQLAFTAFFSFFINSQKFTPYIINSIVLLTISSILLVFQTDSSNSADSSSQISEKNYGIGFISTVVASAVNGLILSLTQFAFNKVVKSKSLKSILDMIVYPGFLASLLTVIGLFVSGEFRGLRGEMEKYEMGKAGYVLTLSFIAITWQVSTLGSFGLIREVSSLFSNSISIVGLPIVPILAVFLFHDTVNGVKVISLVLALWGFMSYVYQQYLDETNNSSQTQHTSHPSDI